MMFEPDLAALLQSRLPEPFSLQLHDCVTSTNTLCAEAAARPDFVSPFFCIAHQQTAGRGRRGRVWDSPPGAGLYVSIACRIAHIEDWQGLSLAVGLVITQTLEQQCGVEGVQLKWPNDILLQGRKLGGVLIEILRDAHNLPVLVIGFGLNCQRPATVQDESGLPRAFLSDAGSSPVDRAALVAELLAALWQLVQDYPRLQFAAYRAAWERYDAYAGQEVVLLAEGAVTACGIEQGVNDQGELRVQVDGVLHCVSTGEVSLRLGGSL